MKLIRRDLYMDELYSLKNTPDIKIITGIRRCGKSMLLDSFIKEIEEKENNINIVRINFNDFENEYLQDYKELHKYIMDKYKYDKTNYLCIDEIQMCKNFEKVINSIHNKQIYDIYITGSNAFMLSSDLATLFTGRYMEVHVFPFSFKEFKEYFTEFNQYELLDKYVEQGGFPGSYMYSDSNKYTNYINNVIEVSIIKDIIKRNNVNDEDSMNRIINYLMDNISNLTSPNKISNALKNDGANIDHKTVANYINYLCKAFVFYKIKRYDIKGKAYLQTNDKYYIADHSARIAKLGHRNMDYGRVYENIVAIELLRRGYEVYVGKLYEKEVDFVAMKGDEKIYIQVSDNIGAKETLERELKPLELIKDSYPKYLIANTRHKKYDINGINIIDLTDWLLK